MRRAAPEEEDGSPTALESLEPLEACCGQPLTCQAEPEGPRACPQTAAVGPSPRLPRRAGRRCPAGGILEEEPKLAALAAARRARPHDDAALAGLESLDAPTYAALEAQAREICLQEGYHWYYVSKPLVQTIMLDLWHLHHHDTGAPYASVP